MALLGEIIDGKYEILREIGKGGMSVVYLAMDKRLNKQWAIKEFRKDKDDRSNQMALKALLDEANLLKKLDHPTLARIVDIIEDHNNVYIVMDYIEGESLNKVLAVAGAQPQDAVIEWAKQLCDVMDYLHTQKPPIIYRDMKPANIMLKPDGTIRLIDFGIAREYKEGQNGDTVALGTRGYAAPEQIEARGQTDPRTDIYALGVTLYHLVTGHNPAEPPYKLYPIRHWNPELSSALEWLIEKCVQQNPEERFQSCAEMTYVLQNIDKFKHEYVKKIKKTVNLFTATVVSAVVLGAASVGCFLGANSMKNNTYESYMALDSVEGYVKASQVMPESPDAYVELAEILGDSINSVTSGSNTLNDDLAVVSDQISLGDLMAWFPGDTMAQFAKQYPEEYARIEFELGFLLWKNFEGSDADKISKSINYFRNVLTVAQNGSAGENAGLTEKEFNLSKMYYCVCFFQNNRKDFEEDAAGNRKELGSIEKFAGIDVETFEDSPYQAFWNTNSEILKILNAGGKDMTDAVKLETLSRLAYILQENQGKFYEEGITADDVASFMNDFQQAISSVSGTKTGNVERLSKLRDTMNKLVIPTYNGLYKLEMEEIA